MPPKMNTMFMLAYHAGAVNTDRLRSRLHVEKLQAIVFAAKVALELFHLIGNVLGGRISVQYKRTNMITTFQKLCANIAAKKTSSTGEQIKFMFHNEFLHANLFYSVYRHLLCIV